jgi:hypothetical protein
MKLVLTHPLRDWWLRLKALTPPAVARRTAPAQPPKPKPARRTIAFLELP